MTWLESLRATAEKATKGPWRHDYQPTGPCGAKCYTNLITSEATYPPVNVAMRPNYDSGGAKQEFANALHIARWDPATVLMVIDVLEQAKQVGCLKYHDTGRDCMKCAGCLLDEKLAHLHQHIEGGGTE